MATKLKIDKDFTPYSTVGGDEIFRNGIFEFNITKMLEYIQENPKNIILEEVNINDFPKGLSSINESHMDLVEISKPVILAEISPEKYNIIDGHHRIEKARRLGITKILAYRFKAEQHLRFLTNKRAYLAYVEYWNSKLEEFIETLKFNQR